MVEVQLLWILQGIPRILRFQERIKLPQLVLEKSRNYD